MLIVSVRLVRTVNSSDGEPVRGSSPSFQPLIHPKSLSPASLSFTGSVWVGTGAFRWVGCVVVPDLRLERSKASLSLYVAGPPSVVLNGFMILDCWLLSTPSVDVTGAKEQGLPAPSHVATFNDPADAESGLSVISTDFNLGQ